MEPSREYIRFYIYTRYKLGFRARPDHEELVTVYGDPPPFFLSVLLSSGGGPVLRTSWTDQAAHGRQHVHFRSLHQAPKLRI